LNDAHLWFHHIEINDCALPWLEFMHLMHNCSSLSMMITPLGELALLCRMGNVDEFCGKFMALSCRGHTFTEGQQIYLFTTWPAEPFRIDDALQ
jgi:hypothetical protein